MSSCLKPSYYIYITDTSTHTHTSSWLNPWPIHAWINIFNTLTFSIRHITASLYLETLENTSELYLGGIVNSEINKEHKNSKVKIKHGTTQITKGHLFTILLLNLTGYLTRHATKLIYWQQIVVKESTVFICRCQIRISS